MRRPDIDAWFAKVTEEKLLEEEQKIAELKACLEDDPEAELIIHALHTEYKHQRDAEPF